MRLDWKTEGAVWQWTGKQNATNGQTGNMQKLWQARSEALIPLVGNNSRFDSITQPNANIYTLQCGG